MTTISETIWWETYKPTHNEVLVDIPKDADINKLWTQVEGDNGEIVIAAGNHIVNRLGYWVTEKSHDFNVEVVDDE